MVHQKPTSRAATGSPGDPLHSSTIGTVYPIYDVERFGQHISIEHKLKEASEGSICVHRKDNHGTKPSPKATRCITTVHKSSHRLLTSNHTPFSMIFLIGWTGKEPTHQKQIKRVLVQDRNDANEYFSVQSKLSTLQEKLLKDESKELLLSYQQL